MKDKVQKPILVLGATLLYLSVFASCAGSPREGFKSRQIQDSLSEIELKKRAALPGVKVVFNASHFYTPFNPNPNTLCAGDASTYDHPYAIKLEEPLHLTQTPLFLKNIGVDLTDSNSLSPLNQSRTCSFQSNAASLQSSSCASFDFSEYNSNFFTFFDHACVNSDSSINSGINSIKAGIYLDIDRQNLGQTENLLLHFTFFPMSPAQSKPDGSLYLENERALFKIHLIRSAKTDAEIQQIAQPRFIIFDADEFFPKIVHSLSVFSSPGGGLQQEQVYLPLSTHPEIDLIRIERTDGSAIFIDAALYRLGQL